MHQIQPTPVPNNHSNYNSSTKPQILHFKSSPSKHQQTEFIQQLYQTPQKKQQTQTSHKLRSQIQERLFYSKYQISLKQIQKESKQIVQEQNTKNDLKSVVIELQNQQNQGYYMYKDWIGLNEYLFSQVQPKFYQNLWKILRLINFGQVAIPSGLIFDIVAEIVNIHLSTKQIEINIIQIINEFLRDNNIHNTYQSFKELQYYIPLSKITKGYRLEQQEVSRSSAKDKQEIFQNLYNDSKIRKLKQTVKILNTQKKQTDGCTFAPLIKPYKTAQKSSRKKQRNCDSVTKNIFQTDRQPIQQQFSYVFKAKPIDPKIYQAKLQNVKGLKQHVNRNVDSYMDKLRLKRSMEKPVILKRN